VVYLDVHAGQTTGLVQFASVLVQLSVRTAHPALGRTAFPHAYATGHAAHGHALLAPAAIVHETRIYNTTEYVLLLLLSLFFDYIIILLMYLRVSAPNGT